MVVPPEIAALVPEKKSSAVRVPEVKYSKYVLASTPLYTCPTTSRLTSRQKINNLDLINLPPGMTSFPVASKVRTPDGTIKF